MTSVRGPTWRAYVDLRVHTEATAHQRHALQPPPWRWPAAASTTPSCPDYFRYIHDDLRPWHSGAGITRDAMERARKYAYFRLVVVGGRAYVETYQTAFQMRDVFTQWGILQLMRRYPGRVPDLDIMFACDDPGQVRAAEFATPSDAPPVFRYCKDKSTLDIVFPDWSFWGWPEVGIRPWTPMLAEIERENKRVPWTHREPLAFWKGNPDRYRIRHDMMKCNVSNGKEWNARLFNQDWGKERQNGLKDSSIPKQCLYRYKIYIEGNAWSVSEKYILACNSPVLFVVTPFQDIMSRGLVAGKHYWPIDRNRICESIRFAVDWGNQHAVCVASSSPPRRRQRVLSAAAAAPMAVVGRLLPHCCRRTPPITAAKRPRL
ncbi:O-glucosyltransferase rumi homolog [Lolium rigidum]|uniref:O-glucosyltransferase rumi homolog n=1 Tax=Lolium rigidum TaxID=89674 RepID=UPI001F5C5883|nr:O-glucosyltransferase rumi homolog [Lolium rigidum]